MSAEVWALVTRPARQADALLTALRQRGLQTLHLPMLSIEPLDPLPEKDRQRLRDLDRYQHLVFISANAAEIGIALIEGQWPQWPVGQQHWAVGASTARLMNAAGLDAQYPEADMSSEGLLALPGLADLEGQRVLIVKGEGGRELLETALRSRGAIVDVLQCYRRAEAVHDAQRCLSLFDVPEPRVILASSGEGLLILSRLLQPQEHTNLAANTVLVPSPRVAEQALALGWRNVACAANASDSAMLTAVDRWRETHLGEKQH